MLQFVLIKFFYLSFNLSYHLLLNFLPKNIGKYIESKLRGGTILFFIKDYL